MTSFAARWFNYLSRRSRLTTRLLHYFGLVNGQATGVARVSCETVWGAQKNPWVTKAIFNIISFFRMLMLDITGKLSADINRLT